MVGIMNLCFSETIELSTVIKNTSSQMTFIIADPSLES